MLRKIGDTVHYVDALDGCVLAEILGIGCWIDVKTTKSESFSTNEGRPIRNVERWYFEDAVYLQLFNDDEDEYTDVKWMSRKNGLVPNT